MKHIDNIFDNLDSWRKLPAYQLERRADVFFSIYLPDILSHRFGVKVEEEVIPEFPIHIGTIRPTDINRSYKVDYLAKANGGKTIMLVELKTDENSWRKKQDEYLKAAKKAGFTKLLEGIRKIHKVTKSKGKYQYLLDLLHSMGFIALDGTGSFEINQAHYDIQIVYIQPNNPKQESNVITFREASEIIEKHGDELSLRFSKSILKWASTRAGGQ